MMKRLLIAAILLASLLSLPLLAGGTAGALDIFGTACDDATANSEVCQRSVTNPISGTEGVILRVVSILSFVIGVASVIMVILGGLKYITSNGDANSISSAKNTILYAIIGVIVAVFSRVIVQFIITKL